MFYPMNIEDVLKCFALSDFDALNLKTPKYVLFKIYFPNFA